MVVGVMRRNPTHNFGLFSSFSAEAINDWRPDHEAKSQKEHRESDRITGHGSPLLNGVAAPDRGGRKLLRTHTVPREFCVHLSHLVPKTALRGTWVA